MKSRNDLAFPWRCALSAWTIAQNIARPQWATICVEDIGSIIFICIFEARPTEKKKKKKVNGCPAEVEYSIKESSTEFIYIIYHMCVEK